MDFVESAKSQWSGRYSWGDENQANTGLSVTGTKILTNYEQYLGTNTRTLTPSIVNEARFGYSRFSNSLGTYSAGVDRYRRRPWEFPDLQPGAPLTWGVPLVSFSGNGFAAIGDMQDGPFAIDDNTLQLVDNVSWTHGKHTLRFGFEYSRQNFNQIGNQFSRGQFAFQANATQSSTRTGGDAFAEFLLGDVFQSTVAVAIANRQVPAQRGSRVCGRHLEDQPETDVVPGPSLRTDSAMDRHAATICSPWRCRTSIAVSNAPDTPYMLRQGDCSDPYAAQSSTRRSAGPPSARSATTDCCRIIDEHVVSRFRAARGHRLVAEFEDRGPHGLRHLL